MTKSNLIIRTHGRKRNRLKGFDYSSDGMYFVTICIKNRIECFGNIKNEEMVLNDYGKIVKEKWLDLPNHYANCELDEYIIMPNHVHGIVIIRNNVGAVGVGFKPAPTAPTDIMYSLSEIIRGFKTFSSKKINQINPNIIFRWQRSFYDHIIRSEKSLLKIRKYIYYNPIKWQVDCNNPENLLM